MAQVQYKTEKVSKKSVYYTGSSIIYTGYPMCFDTDQVTGGSLDNAWRVEKPATGALDNFAGVVSEEYDGKTGPLWINVVQPTPYPGTHVRVRTDVSCTAETTVLGIENDDWELAAASTSVPAVAIATQTLDCSGTTFNDVLARLFTEDQMDLVTATSVALTGGTTGATVGLSGVGNSGEILRLTDACARLKVDVDAIIAAEKKSGRMDLA